MLPRGERTTAMSTTLITAGEPEGVESTRSAVNWGPIIAGAFAAATLTFILMLLGSGLGLSIVSPWSGENFSGTTLAVSTGIWLILVQWLASAFGGYLTG